MLYFRPDPLPAPRKKKKPGKRKKKTPPKNVKTSLTAGDKVIWTQSKNVLSLEREGGVLLWPNLRREDPVTFNAVSQFNDVGDVMAAAALEPLQATIVGSMSGDVITIEFLDAR